MLKERLRRHSPVFKKMAAGLLASLWLVCACTQATTASERRVVTVDVDSARSSQHSDTQIRSEWVSGGDRVEIQARNVELTDDGKDVKAIEPSGYFLVNENRAGVERRLEIVPDDRGGLRRSYSVQGQARAFDSQAQAWLAGLLLDYQRRTDSSAEGRVKWILQRQGAGAVLEEISNITGDQVKRAYLQALFTQSKFDSDVLQRGLEQARKELGNDYDLAELLLWVNEHARLGAGARTSFFKAVDRMGSDPDRRRVLTAAVNAGGGSKSVVEMSLRSAMNFKTDYYLAQFLVELANSRAVGDELRPDFIAAVKRLRSASDQERVMSALGGGNRR